MPNSRRQKQSESGTTITADEDDWTKLSDTKERRKIQNRLAQRQYRKNQKKRQEENTEGVHNFSAATTPAYSMDSAQIDGNLFIDTYFPGTIHEDFHVDIHDHLSSKGGMINTFEDVTYDQSLLDDNYIFSPMNEDLTTSPKLPSHTSDPVQERRYPAKSVPPQKSPLQYSSQQTNSLIASNTTCDKRASHKTPTTTSFTSKYTTNTSTNTTSTILHLAASKGHVSILELLLDKGLDINAPDSAGQTALHVAAAHGYHDAARLLLRKRVHPNQKDHGGQTALHLAALHGHERVVKLLLGHGAVVDECDDDGRTPLQLAVLEGHEGVVRLLLSVGSDVTAVIDK